MTIIFFKLLLKRTSYIVTLLLLPIVALIVAAIAEPLEPTAQNIGVYIEDSSKDIDTFNEVVKLLEKSSAKPIAYKDIDSLKAAVMQGKISSGYIFNSGLTEALQKQDLKNTITSYYLDGNTAGILADEIVASAIIKVATPYITYEFLSDRFDNVDMSKIREKIYAYLESDQMMKIGIESANLTGSPSSVQGREHQASTMAKGVIGVILLSLSVMSAAYISGQLAKDSIKLLATRHSKGYVMLSLALPNTVFTLIFGLLSVIIVSISLGMPLNLLSTAISMIIFTLFMTGLSILLAVIGSELMLSAAMPFIVIGSFIFSPTLIDVSSYIPQLAIFKSISPISIFLAML